MKNADILVETETMPVQNDEIQRKIRMKKLEKWINEWVCYDLDLAMRMVKSERNDTYPKNSSNGSVAKRPYWL